MFKVIDFLQVLLGTFTLIGLIGIVVVWIVTGELFSEHLSGIGFRTIVGLALLFGVPLGLVVAFHEEEKQDNTKGDD